MKLSYSTIIFPDEKQYALKHWRDLLLRTVEWLAATNKLTGEKLPIKRARSRIRYIVNSRPIHMNGEKFRDPRKVLGYYVECNLDVKSIIKYTKMLLREFDVDPASVRLV